ncbi:MAG: alpha-galactosidase [Bacteroidales bacterium]|nr:alpha-galactosidase [Bacteroidales bacterium]
MKLQTLLFSMLVALPVAAQTIPIRTDHTDLILKVAPNHRLYQVYLGERLLDVGEYDHLDWDVYAASDASVSQRGWEVCNTGGSEEFYEPALGITHTDGSQTTYLYYRGHETKAVDGGTETVIRLADDQYPVQVTLHYVAYPREDVIKVWSEILHHEKAVKRAGSIAADGCIALQAIHSTILYFRRPSYYLTEFSSDWAREAQMSSQQLQFGKKVVDTKLGSRAAMHAHPFFEIGLGQEVRETQGEVLMGTIAWSGNWRYTAEVDNAGALRILPGLNPNASAYRLRPGETFRTPEFIFTLSRNGTGQGSRNLQSWARRYQLRDGMGPRMSLLNNWENTYFNFDQEKLTRLMKEAKTLGVDMFLLDDGWFGNGGHARNGDSAGLGDWDVNRSKLPGGIPALCDAADGAGVKFGIWIEPEMVNPRSDLFEAHPDWAIRLPNREYYTYRNQLVLDMSNPAVQEYVYGVVARILTDGHDSSGQRDINGDARVAYFKWDCNSPITNAYSPYLGDRQSNLYIDHIRGVYNVMRRVRENFPDTPMMLCSGGGARCDYEALKYFTEFWCSDDTDPVERLYIQWGFSQFFPAKAMCAHVTDWNRQAPVKFRTDVASMCKLGFDLGLRHLSADDLAYCQQAVANWKRLQPVILDGEQYRLVSPYDGNHMAVNYVSQDRRHAVLFAYDIHPRYKEPLQNVRLQGLDADRNYQVEEINLMPGQASSLKGNGQVYSGDYLMKIGLEAFTQNGLQSRVIEIKGL